MVLCFLASSLKKISQVLWQNIINLANERGVHKKKAGLKILESGGETGGKETGERRLLRLANKLHNGPRMFPSP